MGMAASQARYLALTARKTNTEYEGQQINQARTALANQSANLFNRLLSMEVPNPPKTTDFTKLQYSYSDGQNEAVIDDWEQLSSADPNYNYIVNHYYYANIYTGSQKLLQNPEVTLKGQVQTEDINARVPAPTVSYRLDSSGDWVFDINGTTVYVPVTSLSMDKELENSIKDLKDGLNNPNLQNTDIYAYKDNDDTYHFMLYSDYVNGNSFDYITEYKPTYVGNCPLTELTNPLEEPINAELSQIIKDVQGTNLDNYLSFDPINGLTYSGSGIYQFQMNGVTYYASEMDLLNSMQTQDEYGKPIENQDRLPYFNASYVKTRIEETNKALLETDGQGRFKSIKFDDDSIVYSLNTETVTDEAAYEDAMNQYLYEKEKYEKTIADINAKTSIIQKEDRTLELRLKQLDTEQNALKTEMDAVKKVIKDNVDSTFKTFSD
ncbi:MAG: hypothetical protein MJ230_06480 [bacterium]|nr:hypothetical protein [bacterium]